MPSSFTSNKGLELPGYNDYVDSWNTPVNSNSSIVDAALGGVTYLNATAASGDITLTTTQYRPFQIIISGTLTANVRYLIPSGVGGQWTVTNNTSGAFTLRIASAAGGSDIILSSGTIIVSCDGTANGMRYSIAPTTIAGSTGYVQYNNGGALGASANLFWDIANSRLGVGTDAPTDKFQVNVQDGVRLGATGNISYVLIGSAFTSEATAQISYDRTSGGTIFSAGNTGSALTENMRIDGTGNVGIGTSSPSEKLSVEGGGISVNNSGAGATGYIEIGGTDGAYVDLKTPFADDFDFRLFTNSTAHQLLGKNAIPMVFSTNDLERMRIDSSGNVGIGTSSPVGKLDIVTGTYRAYFDDPGGTSVRLNGVVANNTAYGPLTLNGSILALQTGGNERARIDSSGNVGIGTSSPGNAKLNTQGFGSYRGNAYTIASFAANSILAPLNIVQATDGTIPGISAGQNSSAVFSSLGFYTSEAERMRIDSSGNVGIGTNSPGYKLDVNGTVNATNLLINGSNTSFLNPSGSVIAYAGSSAPSGWLMCDGSAVSRAVYAALFAVVGTTYGAGDGSTTFNLPNLVNRFSVGAGGTYALASTGGNTSVTTSTAGSHNHTGLTGSTTLTTAQIPAHNHSVTDPGHVHAIRTGGDSGYGGGVNSGVDLLAPFSFRGENSASSSTGISIQNTGGGSGHNHSISTDGAHTHTAATVPPYLALNYIIKT
jgi:microcystin-dependent protein